MSPGTRLTKEMALKTIEERTEMSKYPYINAVGALIYLATCTHPDIVFTVSQLARFNSDPGLPHWHAVKHLARYLKGSMDLKLAYAPNMSSSKSFSDAAYC